MTTVSMTIRVTPEQKALHLCAELAAVSEELNDLKEQFPPRGGCLLVGEGKAGKTCREQQAELCPRCEFTEPLAKQWQKVKGRQRNTIRKIVTLGKKHSEK